MEQLGFGVMGMQCGGVCHGGAGCSVIRARRAVLYDGDAALWCGDMLPCT